MINGDNKLGLLDKILYFPQCISSWAAGERNTLYISAIKLNLIKESIGAPSRILSNMFWETIDWDNLASQLGGDVNIFDIACGRGHYGLKYCELLGNNFGSYTGLDIYKHNDFPIKFSHVLDKAENAAEYLDEKNLVVSQSGMEHIEKDIYVLKEITNALLYNGKPFIQIHLVPAAASLFLYLWHGWRQYSAKNLSAISNNLSSCGAVKTKVVPLGGVRSFVAHFSQITIPILFARLFKREYNDWNIDGTKASSRIKSAVIKDRCVNSRIPSFWALIVYSNSIKYKELFKNDYATHDYTE